ncbi:CCA tRNA nucleotidyltransferase [Thalassobium sp. R2A62]|uniref:CCA tRNA nucleotidyltransferase n=1 Tax=Thalassobium sp. R2A62 TaxID=633131 RepID=UPI0001B1D080|nr:CCA tRNA nucleotidyltransferase [Thalassobium sp. R2A62]EET46777.1 poly A polymerase family protein [Thalassobium sp. R2A62]
MTQIDGQWMKSPAVQRVFEIYADAGFELFFVGGCVRNAVLDLPIHDVDLSSNATPEQGTKIASAAGLKVISTGYDHGTITVVSDGTPLEITSFRRDVETYGRRAVVAYSQSIDDDARRRDFTMNALYARATGEVVDPLGGLLDLYARRLRFIENADQRIQEDFLRSLRFFRFHALYADQTLGFEPEAIAAISGNLDGLETLPKERIGAEMVKLLAATDPAPAIATMGQCGVLMRVLPGAAAAALAVLVHVEEAYSVAPNAIRRLCVVGGEDPVRDLRLSKAQAKELNVLKEGLGSLMSAAELGYRLGSTAAIDVLLLRAATAGMMLDPREIDAAIRGDAQVCPIAASDLSDSFQGWALGEELKRLEAVWIASDLSATKSELLG